MRSVTKLFKLPCLIDFQKIEAFDSEPHIIGRIDGHASEIRINKCSQVSIEDSHRKKFLMTWR